LKLDFGFTEVVLREYKKHSSSLHGIGKKRPWSTLQKLPVLLSNQDGNVAEFLTFSPKTLSSKMLIYFQLATGY
jgi:hypothetical protein